MFEATYQVTAGGDRPFCAGIVARDNRVVKMAPILRRYADWPIRDVADDAAALGHVFAPVSLKVLSFDGPFRFLSNFHPSPIAWQGEAFSTLEHAYQWSKMTDATDRHAVRTATSPGIAKRVARSRPMRPDWDDIKLEIMLMLLRVKFAEPRLRGRLLATDGAELVEGNTWGDVYWGVCGGVGENHLGRLLMQARAEIAND